MKQDNEHLEQQDGNEQTDCAKCSDYLDGWKRAQADYQNLQKQTERDRVDFRKYATQSLLEDLIPVLDQFDLAMKFMPSIEPLPPDERAAWKNWRIGVEAVKMKWDELAKEQHLAPVETDGAFNPELHEAVEEREDASAKPGDIIEVVEPGWKLYDKVIRPAKVIIATSTANPKD